MRIRLNPYKRGSKGARLLARTLGVLRTKKGLSYDTDTTFINWGMAETGAHKGRILNHPNAVCKAGNKLATLEILADAGVPITPFSTRRVDAEAWRAAGFTVVSRSLLRASQGRGIGIHPADGEALPNVPLYTQYVKKTQEYRVHVVGDEIVDVQQKKKRQEVPNESVNYQIRNSHNGWVYCREGVEAPACVRDAARRAVHALGLDFGGVDVGYHAPTGTCAVYEVNTAPGQEGSTPLYYLEGFKKLIPALHGGAFARRRKKWAL